MAEEGEGQEYQLVTESGETLKKSRGYKGFGTATYPNGDIYEGYFEEGIRSGDGTYKYANKGKFSNFLSVFQGARSPKIRTKDSGVKMKKMELESNSTLE